MTLPTPTSAGGGASRRRASEGALRPTLEGARRVAPPPGEAGTERFPQKRKRRLGGRDAVGTCAHAVAGEVAEKKSRAVVRAGVTCARAPLQFFEGGSRNRINRSRDFSIRFGTVLARLHRGFSSGFGRGVLPL